MNKFLEKTKQISIVIKGFYKINPHKHWVFLLYIFFTLIFFLILFSLYLLYQIKNDQIFQVKIKNISTQSLLKEDLLKSTLDTFNKKEKIGDELQNNKDTYPDPS